MPSYLWPMTSLRPVLARYRLVRFGPCVCLSSICVQNLPVAHSSTVVWRLAYTVCHPFFDLFCELLFDFPLPLRAGLYISFGPFLDCPHFLPYHSVISTVMTQSCWTSLGLPFIFSPSGLTWPLVFLLMGFCVPFVFLLSILIHLLSLGFLNPFTNSAFSWAFPNFNGLSCPNYLILILEVHGLAINPLLYLFALLWVCNGSFSFF